MFAAGLIFLSAIIGALSWRGRGGWFGFGNDTLSRLGGVFPLLPLAYFAGGWMPVIAALCLLPPLYLGWGDWQDMGRVADNDDFVGMTGRGFLQGSLAGAALGVLYHPMVGLAYPWVGALMGPVYWLSWYFGANVKPVAALGNNLVDGPTSIAELCTGAVLYAGFISLVLSARWL